MTVRYILSKILIFRLLLRKQNSIKNDFSCIGSKDSKFIVLTESNNSYTFNSPGYPNGYSENLQMSWTFVSPPGTHVLLRFLSMNLEESEGCVTDYVAIYEGHVTTFDSNENLVTRLCLSNATMTSISGQNTMTVQFVSDSYLNGTGFSAIALARKIDEIIILLYIYEYLYGSIEITECGGVFEESFGVIQFNNTSGYTRFRPYIYACEWTVKVRTGRRIRVKVEDYNIESNQPKTDDNSCRSNFILVCIYNIYLSIHNYLIR